MKFDFRQHLPTLLAQGLEPVQKNGLRCSEARFHIFYYIIVSGNWHFLLTGAYLLVNLPFDQFCTLLQKV